MSPAISIRNLGKRYQVSHAQERASYQTLRDSLARAATAPLRRLRGENGDPTEEFWALKDVSFDIQPGEVVGIIGRNGSGKSTLLKILSRITKPTTGEVEINGRVGSLLEVGTGFHPELSGRENIYMNGSILGMSRREIQRQFDKIVDFSGVEKFLDTPVKRYSSGMYVRLAFAVAAHLEPEVMLVDEVLAVGDAEFQRRCLRKIADIASSGRTALFVSHSMAAVTHLCKRSILLSHGAVTMAGPTDEVVAAHLSSTGAAHEAHHASIDEHRTPGMIKVFRKITTSSQDGSKTTAFSTGSPITIRIEYAFPKPLPHPRIIVVLESLSGQRLFALNSAVQHREIAEPPAEGIAICRVPALPLIPGNYKLTFICATPNNVLDTLERLITLSIDSADFFGTGCLPKPEFGHFLVPAQWDFQASCSIPTHPVIESSVS